MIFPEYAGSKVRDCLHVLTWLCWWSDCSHPALFTPDFSLTGNGALGSCLGKVLNQSCRGTDRFARLLLWEPLIPQCILSASCICCFKIRKETSMSLRRVTLIDICCCSLTWYLFEKVSPNASEGTVKAGRLWGSPGKTGRAEMLCLGLGHDIFSLVSKHQSQDNLTLTCLGLGATTVISVPPCPDTHVHLFLQQLWDFGQNLTKGIRVCNQTLFSLSLRYLIWHK